MREFFTVAQNDRRRTQNDTLQEFLSSLLKINFRSQ
jgi:hypothetical protein